ncbi:MAG: hypothetical protein WCO63_09545 [Bacteroidota bacterium]
MRSIFLIFLLCPLWLLAQEKLPTNKNGKVIFQGNGVVEGLFKTQVFDLCKAWCTREFVEHGGMIENEDNVIGKIAGKARVPLALKTSNDTETNGILTFDFYIHARSYYFEYIFSNLQWVSDASSMPLENFNEGHLPCQVDDRNTINMYVKRIVSEVEKENKTNIANSNTTQTDNIHLSANYLKSAGSNFAVGGGLILFSSGLAHIAQVNYDKEKDNANGSTSAINKAEENYNLLYYLSLGVGVVGAIEFIVGSVQLNRSGNHLRETANSKISFKIKPDRISLCYCF